MLSGMKQCGALMESDNGKGMGAPDWRGAVTAYIREQARPVDKYGHQPRLYALTRKVGEGGAYDDDVVFAAAWLHDLGVFVGHRPEALDALAAWDNVAYAMRLAPELLGRLGFLAEKIPAVIEVIRTHLPGREPTCREGAILRDADILEQLGATGILRVVSKVGRDTRFPTFAEAIAALRRQLAELPGQLRLPTARRLAEPRIALLRAFLAGADAEGETGQW
jgi:uncharacterized protein